MPAAHQAPEEAHSNVTSLWLEFIDWPVGLEDRAVLLKSLKYHQYFTLPKGVYSRSSFISMQQEILNQNKNY